MRRPRPIQRLIDGPPDASGKAVSRRATLLLIPAILLSNAIGAIVVFVLLVFVFPTPETDAGEETLVIINLAAGGGYLLVASAVGTIWSFRRFAPVRGWLIAGTPPDKSIQRKALRAPIRQALVNATLWVLAAIGATALNTVFSVTLGVLVLVTVLIGGITTCAASYLTAERIYRPVIARALVAGVPERPALPGVTVRALLTWGLGSALPIVGLIILALVALTDEDVSTEELAISALALGGVSVIVGFGLTWQSARAVSQPLNSVRRALKDVERGDLERQVHVDDGSELGLLQAGFNRMGAGLRERERLRDLFGRHVGEDVAQEALRTEIELGGEERDVAVLFIDVVGSTRLAAERPAHDVVTLLNRFFADVVDTAEANGGTVNKFEGDAALVLFGAPIPRENSASCALKTARELAARLGEDVPELDVGIGVSAGPAVAGNIGAESRFEYTVIGDPVNEAARLSDMAKQHASRVLAAARAVEEADDDEGGRWCLGETVRLRGRTEDTRLAAPGAGAADGGDGGGPAFRPAEPEATSAG